MITQSRLKDLLDYDPATGLFVWKVSRGTRARLGAIAGSRSGHGYLTVMLEKRKYYLHKLAWLYVHGYLPTLIDHADGNRFNNAIDNLRPANRSLNAANSKRATTNSSGFKGVSYHKSSSMWRAYITCLGKQKHLGLFNSPESAHAAYAIAAGNLFGDYARAE